MEVLITGSRCTENHTGLGGRRQTDRSVRKFEIAAAKGRPTAHLQHNVTDGGHFVAEVKVVTNGLVNGSVIDYGPKKAWIQTIYH